MFHHRISVSKTSRQVKGAKHASGGSRQSRKLRKGRCVFSLCFASGYISKIDLPLVKAALVQVTFPYIFLSPSEINFTEDEDDIVQVIIDFQKAGFPITVSKLRVLAWQYDHINKINAFAHNKDNRARHTWAKYFLKCYSNIRV